MKASRTLSSAKTARCLAAAGVATPLGAPLGFVAVRHRKVGRMIQDRSALPPRDGEIDEEDIANGEVLEAMRKTSPPT